MAELIVSLGFSCSGVYNEHGYIDAVEHLLCAQNSLLAERALVVKAGGVNDHHRTERQ